MPAKAGDLLYGGIIDRLSYRYIKAGGGSAGLNAARLELIKSYPGITRQSINAVMDRLQQSYSLGRRYTSGSGGYVPDKGVWLDVRPIERAAGITGQLGGNPVKNWQYYNNVYITITDSLNSGKQYSSFMMTVPSDEPLSKDALEELASAKGTEFTNAFRDTVSVGRDIGKLTFKIQFAGGYLGYR